MALATYAHFADRDPLTRVVLEQMLAGVSTRRFERTREPVGSEVEQEARSTSKSAVSREFVARTRENLEALMARRLDDVRLAVMMIDGIDLKAHTNVVALGITTEGVKIPLGLWGRSTENGTVGPRCCRISFTEASTPSKGSCSRSTAPERCARRSGRCSATKPRCSAVSATGTQRARSPGRTRPPAPVKRRLRRAWRKGDHDRALADLQLLAGELDRSHRGAASSLREGMAKTFTLTRLGITGKPKATLESTNPCESMIECVRRSARNVKRWQSGDMALRWSAAGILEAEQQFRRIIGYKDLAKLALAVEREIAQATVPTRPVRRPLRSPPSDHHTGTAVKGPRRTGHPPQAAS